MTQSFRAPWILALAVLAPVSFALAGCGAEGTGAEPDPDLTFYVGTEEDRAALFDFLVESTLEWDAFASLPDHPYYRAHPKEGLDVVAEMERYRDELIAADTDEKMWFVLHKISNARKDRHLNVEEVEGGLVVPDSLKVQVEAPIRFATDFAVLDDRFFFVADRGLELTSLANGSTPELGDRLVAINGRPVNEWVQAWRPYQRYSTENHFWWRIAEEITRTRDHVPHSEFYGDVLALELEGRDGSRYRLELPYQEPDEIRWEGHTEREYPGFSPVPGMGEYETYNLYLPDDGALPVVLLQWYGFRADLPEAMDRLMEYAEEHGLLEHNVIVDATRSRGGSRGAYAVQRIQPRPFRTTFGNLKVSPAMERWVEDRIERIRAEPASARETVDGGNWLLDWLETDVLKAIEAGNRYTNDVPFKGAHAPKWADGIIDPAPVHFKGELTVWLSSQGGSHLDQFASQVVDNDLGHVIGMPAGGFSNTWQATEVLRFPTTGAPIVSYQWSMGHSIRPNKEILQYNPAEVHEYIPQTRDNYFDYHARLLELTFQRLGVG
jgi:hypothetical protein